MCCRGIGAATRAYLGAIGAERGVGDDAPLLAHPRGLHLRRGGPPSPPSLRNRDLEAAARVYGQREGRRSGRREFVREWRAIGGKEKVFPFKYCKGRPCVGARMREHSRQDDGPTLECRTKKCPHFVLFSCRRKVFPSDDLAFSQCVPQLPAGLCFVTSKSALEYPNTLKV